MTCRGIDDSIIRNFAMTAIQAGIEGKKLPRLGDLSADELAVINSVYDTARNLRASFGIFDQP